MLRLSIPGWMWRTPEAAIALLYILGGLLLVVMLMVAVMTGAGLGGWFGEQMASARWTATIQAVAADTELGADLRRWRAVVRSLAQQPILSVCRPLDRLPDHLLRELHQGLDGSATCVQRGRDRRAEGERG